MSINNQARKNLQIPFCRSRNSCKWIPIGYCLELNIHTCERRRYCIICGNYYRAEYFRCPYCRVYKLMKHARDAILLAILILLGWLYS